MITKDNQDIPVLQSSKAMEKAQDIANKIFKSTPHLFRELPTDSLFKNQGNNTPSNAYTPKPTPPIRRPDSNTMKDSKRRTLAVNNLNATLPTNLYSPNQGWRPDLSTVDWQKKYYELENKYKKLEEDIRVLQLDKNDKENRYVKREVGYRKLIDELHEELRRDFSLSGNDRKKMEEVAGLHARVIDNINNIQLKTSKVLMDQEKDIIRFFNNKINEIKKQFEEERIKRGKKDQSYEVKEKQLIAELEWIKDIAQKIDQENHTLMKKYMDLKALYSTQENDREILLREVILKKKKNAILKNQIDQYEKILEEVGREKDIQNSSVSQDQNNSVNQQHQSAFKDNEGDVTLSQYNSGKGRSQFKSTGMNERAQTAGSTQARIDYVINKFRTALQREKRKVQQLKTLYIKELESKSTLEKVLRSCIEDVKDDIFAMQKEKIATAKKLTLQNDVLNKQERADLVEKLINDERVLTMLYDKTFYASNKKIEIPQELLQEDEDDEIDGLAA